MFKKMVESSGNVVGYKVIGDITASDYKELEPQVKALVKKKVIYECCLIWQDYQDTCISLILPMLITSILTQVKYYA